MLTVCTVFTVGALRAGWLHGLTVGAGCDMITPVIDDYSVFTVVRMVLVW